MEFTVVPAGQQEQFKTSKKAAWFEAMLEHGMVAMTTRPTISKGQSAVLEAQGQRVRTSAKDGKVYVWVEDVPSEDLAEAGPPLDDDELPA